jgi:hypothetical protein
MVIIFLLSRFGLITVFLQKKITKLQAQSVWIAMYGFFVENPSLNQQPLTYLEGQKIVKLLEPTFTVKNNFTLFVDEVIKLGNAPKSQDIGNSYIHFSTI